MKFKSVPISVWGKYFVMLLIIPWVLGIFYLLYELAITVSMSEKDLFGNVRAILLTLAALIGVPFLIWRAWLADKQTRINQESHYTDLFTKAMELLSATRVADNGKTSPAIESRVGAIFALERLAKQSQTDYGSIIETLSAYIREQCGSSSGFVYDGEDPDEDGISKQEQVKRLRAWSMAMWKWSSELRKNPPADRADVAAALTVLARRKDGRSWTGADEKEVQPRLSGANLQGANLGETMKGLAQDNITISAAHLEGARLSGFDLDNSSVLGAQIKYDHSFGYLIGPKSLVGVVAMSLTIKEAEFFPILNGAELSFANMNGSKCSGASFRGARLGRANFENAIAQKVKFGVADARNARFDGTDLSNAEFIGALLRDTTFVGANLSNAKFEGAFLRGAKFEGALLIGTDLMGANEVEAEMIEKAYGTSDTALPSGLIRPEHWKDEDSAVEQWKAFRNERGI